jgi:hypothetical protein
MIWEKKTETFGVTPTILGGVNQGRLAGVSGI